MSRSNRQAKLERFPFPNSGKLWHDEKKPQSPLGCTQCHYRSTCGGLQIDAQIFDCLSFCRCVDVAKCDNVCPKNLAHFIGRLQEVGGLSLDNVPTVPKTHGLELPSVVPMVYHSSARTRTPTVGFMSVSLYELFDRVGNIRYKTHQSLIDHLGINLGSTLILSGTDIDPPLERWWNLPDRTAMARDLVAIGVKLVTSPNYSLFDDVPRHDNMYNMKRIAVASAEIQSAGIPCAIHLNARTDKDWARWVDFLRIHDEYDYVTFEFGTGAGVPLRSSWYVEKLCRLADQVVRPLSLLVRGGMAALPVLSSSFSSVTLIDTAAFVRSQYRRRGVPSPTGIKWEKALTEKGQPIDDLFDENISAVEVQVQMLLGEKFRPSVHLRRGLGTADNTCNESLDASRLAETCG